MSTYFDAVLTKNMQPVFNGTPEATKKWLRKRLSAHPVNEVNTLQVCDGRTLRVMTVSEYMQR